MCDRLAKMLENKLNNQTQTHSLTSTMDSISDKFEKYGNKVSHYKA